jgi:tRNA(fMet)-specific endonuclease VapC
MPTYMLDTDTVSYSLRGVGNVNERLLEHQPSQLCISSITLAELRFGASKRKSRKLENLIDTFTASVQVMPFEVEAAATFGKIAARLQGSGSPIGDFDTLIAAHAISLDLVLVTNNRKHFEKIPQIRLENWAG